MPALDGAAREPASRKATARYGDDASLLPDSDTFGRPVFPLNGVILFTQLLIGSRRIPHSRAISIQRAWTANREPPWHSQCRFSDDACNFRSVLLARQRGALEPVAVIQAVRKLLVLLSHRKQLLADMLDRLSFGHAAEFVGFLLVVRRSLFGGPRWEIHFPGHGCRCGKGACTRHTVGALFRVKPSSIASVAPQ